MVFTCSLSYYPRVAVEAVSHFAFISSFSLHITSLSPLSSQSLQSPVKFLSLYPLFFSSVCCLQPSIQYFSLESLLPSLAVLPLLLVSLLPFPVFKNAFLPSCYLFSSYRLCILIFDFFLLVFSPCTSHFLLLWLLKYRTFLIIS